MLSRERAVKFLREGLQIEDVERKLESDRLLLLKEVLRHHVAYLPYQFLEPWKCIHINFSIKGRTRHNKHYTKKAEKYNSSLRTLIFKLKGAVNFLLLAQDHETRKIPSFEQIIEDCISLKGGTCSVLNIFLNFLLKALGYNSEIQGSTVNHFPDIPNHHLLNLVRGVEQEDDLYLVDPAAVYPNFDIIPLHSITTFSPVYSNAFMECRYGKEDDIITRFHRKAKITLFSLKEQDDDWRPFYYFSLKVQELTDILAGIQKTYDERTSACLRAISFTVYPFGKAMTILRSVFRVWNEETLENESKELKDLDDIYNALLPVWKGADKEVMTAAFHNLPPPKNNR